MFFFSSTLFPAHTFLILILQTASYKTHACWLTLTTRGCGVLRSTRVLRTMLKRPGTRSNRLGPDPDPTDHLKYRPEPVRVPGRVPGPRVSGPPWRPLVQRAGPYWNRGFPTRLWMVSRLLIRAKVWNAPFTLGPTQQGLSPPPGGREVCLFRIYALQLAGLLRIPSPGFTSWTFSPWPPKCCWWVTDSSLCYLYSCVFAASHSNYSVQPFMLLLLSALYWVQLQLFNV